MEWTSLVTGAWLDWGLKGCFFAFDVQTRIAAIVDGGTTVFTATTLTKVGKSILAILAILDHATETKNKYVYVSSFDINQVDLLHVLEKVDGQKWTVQHERLL